MMKKLNPTKISYIVLTALTLHGATAYAASAAGDGAEAQQASAGRDRGGSFPAGDQLPPSPSSDDAGDADKAHPAATGHGRRVSVNILQGGIEDFLSRRAPAAEAEAADTSAASTQAVETQPAAGASASVTEAAAGAGGGASDEVVAAATQASVGNGGGFSYDELRASVAQFQRRRASSVDAEAAARVAAAAAGIEPEAAAPAAAQAAPEVTETETEAAAPAEAPAAPEAADASEVTAATAPVDAVAAQPAAEAQVVEAEAPPAAAHVAAPAPVWPGVSEIDFSVGSPAFVLGETGLSDHEPWGRWSDAALGEKVVITTNAPLPNRFGLRLGLIAFGNNVGQQMPIQIGRNVYEITLQAEQDELIEFDLEGVPADAIIFTPPLPQAPGNGDPRLLAVGFKNLSIEPR